MMNNRHVNILIQMKVMVINKIYKLTEIDWHL